jgi:hypothetical protein
MFSGNTLTKYEVLVPVTPIIADGLYMSAGYVYFETEAYKSKTPEWVKEMLIKSGEYAKNIRVINA